MRALQCLRRLKLPDEIVKLIASYYVSVLALLCRIQISSIG